MKHVLKIEEWHNSEYCGFTAYELWQRDDEKQYYTATYDDNNNRIKGIKLYCQRNRYASDNTLHTMYAFNVTPINIPLNWMSDSDEVESDVKRIKSIGKKYDKLCAKYGKVKSFTQFVSYIASILDTPLVREVEYDEYNPMSLDNLSYWEDQLNKY